MSDVKEKHPTWFKMKIERRQLVKQLEPKTAVNVPVSYTHLTLPTNSLV